MNEHLSRQKNTNERRFTLATETSARTRLDSFRDGIKYFQKDNPEVLGATVYGSMIKGEQAKDTSDIDAYLYIDQETIPTNEKGKDKNTLESEYLNNFLNSLNISEDEKSKYYHDLRPKLLSSEVLDNEINTRNEYYNQMKEFKRMLEEKYTYEASEEEKERMLSQEPQIKDDFAISGLFHARVGSGIEKYRRLFLDKISALPNKETAEKIWSDIYSDLKTFEQRSDPTKMIDIPSTLSDAIRVYHPDSYKQNSKQKDNDKIEELKSQISKLF